MRLSVVVELALSLQSQVLHLVLLVLLVQQLQLALLVAAANVTPLSSLPLCWEVCTLAAVTMMHPTLASWYPTPSMAPWWGQLSIAPWPTGPLTPSGRHE